METLEHGDWDVCPSVKLGQTRKEEPLGGREVLAAVLYNHDLFYTYTV